MQLELAYARVTSGADATAVPEVLTAGSANLLQPSRLRQRRKNVSPPPSLVIMHQHR